MDSIKTCSVCFSDYDTKERAPRVLSCGHSLCSTCLAGILKKSSLRKCPFDNFPFTQNSLASFPLNFVLMELLEERSGNMCKIHPEQKLRWICFTDNVKICSECVKNGDHKGHRTRKIKELKAQGAKVKGELQETLLKIREYEQEKEEDFEKIRKVLIGTILEKVDEMKKSIVDKENEWIYQVNNLFKAEGENEKQAIEKTAQQMTKNIEDITAACKDDKGNMMVLDREVNNIGRIKPEFLKEKASRVIKKAVEIQKFIQESCDASKMVVNGLDLPSREFIKEVYSPALNKEELSNMHNKLMARKFLSHFVLKTQEERGSLRIYTGEGPQPKEIEVSKDNFQAIEKIYIQLKRYDILMREQSPNILSYIFRGINEFTFLDVSFDCKGWNNDSLFWLDNTISEKVKSLKYMSLNLKLCEIDDNSFSILCKRIISKLTSLQFFYLNLNSSPVIDADLSLLVESLKPFHKNFEFFALGLEMTEVTDDGLEEIFDLVKGMENLKDLRLILSNIHITDGSLKIFGEKVLPQLKNLEALTLDVSDNGLADEGICAVLRNLPNVKRLVLSMGYTGVTDKTMEVFFGEARMGSLEYLSVNAAGTKVSEKNRNRILDLSISLKLKEYEMMKVEES